MLKKKLKSFVKKHYTLRKLLLNLIAFYNNNRNSVAKINNQGCCKIRKYFRGSNNVVNIGKGCLLHDTQIRMVGHNNMITFGENVIVGPDCSFWLEGDDNVIEIGEGTTFNHTVHFCAQEKGTKIIVGKDCQFSLDLIVRTSDSHPIYDSATNERINNAKDVIIGNHVWIAPGTRVFKGVKIGDNSIIGSNSLITHDIPSDSLAVGSPAKVIKTGVFWTREHMF